MSTVAPTGKSRGMIIGIVVVIILLVVGVGVYFTMNPIGLFITGPSAPGPSASGPSASGPSALGPSAAGPSQYMGLLGPSAAGPSASGPSRPKTTGPSRPKTTGPSASGPSRPATTGPSAPVILPKGRFIKLIQTVAYDENDTNNKNKVINLAELEVFNPSGVNVASGKTVTGSSQYSTTYGYVNLTDGNKTNFAHTNGKTIDEYDYLQVDLGDVKEIKKIVITNRTTNNSVKDRAKGIKAIIYANNGTTLVKETPMITTRADTYTLTFPENVWS